MPKELLAVLQRQVTAAIFAGDLEGAEGALARLEQEDPLSAATRGLRLEVLLATGRHDDAARLAEGLVEQFPGSARIRRTAGQVALARREHAAAVAHLRESEKLSPHALTRRLLGQALTNLGVFAEAEALLLDAVATYPRARKDLAWLYERKGELARAANELERYAKEAPDDAGAKAILLRLRARSAEPQALIGEVDALVELGERIAPQLVPEYVARLLERGEGARARSFVAEHRPALDAATLTKTAWVAYQRQAHDLAFELFVAVLPGQAKNPKLLTSLCASARRAGKLAELVSLLEQHAPQEPRLYGWAARIRRELA